MEDLLEVSDDNQARQMIPAHQFVAVHGIRVKYLKRHFSFEMTKSCNRKPKCKNLHDASSSEKQIRYILRRSVEWYVKLVLVVG